MRRRNHHRPKVHSLKNYLKTCSRWLKRLWRSIIKSLRIFFNADLDRDSPSRSPRSLINRPLINEEVDQIDFLSSNQQIAPPRSVPFLLGLDDIHNLESLTTSNLLQLIEWNAESQEIIVAKEEDLNLLEDLLVNFPGS